MDTRRNLSTTISARGSDVVGKLRDSPFVRNVMTVMAGSGVAQAIGLGLAPVISRLFTPADFGVLGSFVAVTGVIAATATFDYSQALMLPKEREDAGQVLLLSCLATLAVTASCAVIGLLFPAWLTGLVKAEGVWLLPLLLLAVLAGGLNASLQAWCVRIKAFRHTSTSQVVRGVSSNGMQVASGLWGAGAVGLVFSTVLAEFLASLNLLRLTWSDLGTSIARTDWRRLRHLAAEYRDFPLYSATQNLLNALSNGLPVLLLTQFFGIAVAGGYAFGLRLLNAPVSLVFSALRQVLFQKAAEMQHRGRPLWPLFVKTTAALFAAGLAPTLLLAVWAPRLFTWVFGSRWEIAGGFARYLMFWILFSFCNLPAVLFARLIRIQRTMFVFNLVLLAMRMSALVLGGLYLTATQSVALFSIVGAVMNLALILLVGNRLRQQEAQVAIASSHDGLETPPLDP